MGTAIVNILQLWTTLFFCWWSLWNLNKLLPVGRTVHRAASPLSLERRLLSWQKLSMTFQSLIVIHIMVNLPTLIDQICVSPDHNPVCWIMIWPFWPCVSHLENIIRSAALITWNIIIERNCTILISSLYILALHFSPRGKTSHGKYAQNLRERLIFVH